MKNLVNIQADNIRVAINSQKPPVYDCMVFETEIILCRVLGDEVHYIFYNCARIKRDDVVLPQNLDELWQNPNEFKLFSRLKEIGVL